jgi:hypothetical protein
LARLKTGPTIPLLVGHSAGGQRRASCKEKCLCRYTRETSLFERVRMEMQDQPCTALDPVGLARDADTVSKHSSYDDVITKVDGTLLNVALSDQPR